MPDTRAGRRVPSRPTFVVFAAIAALGSTVIMLLMVLALDIYLHHRFQTAVGLNVWGFRGPTLGRKLPGETRVAVLGGSQAFGYGVRWDEALPYLLERDLEDRDNGRFTVANLAFNGEGAYSLRYTLEDYEYLDYDIAILYEGYNDLGQVPNLQVVRHVSSVFRLSGYFPILPLVFREKAESILHGGDLAAAYEGRRVVFQPTIAQRASAAALEKAVDTAESLERQLGRLTRNLSDERVVSPNSGCGDRWRHYCGSIFEAVAWALAHDKKVLVVGQPYISDPHIDQQNALAGMLQDRFGADRRVQYVNLGRVIALSDRNLAYDGMHLTRPGNAIVAEKLVAPVLEIARK